MAWLGHKIMEPEMVRMRSGEFLMGAPESESGSHSCERPEHKVRIGYSFEVSKYPITFREWDAAAELGACDGYKPSDETWGRGVRPVINVSWEDARAYLRFLIANTGKTYRLLSESEWEYCCRANTSSAYSFGNAITNDQANYQNSSTVPVTSFPANQFGLVGMHGNVWEWCEDCWHDTYHGAPEDGRPWFNENDGNCTRAVLRGGSRDVNPVALRSASRDWVERVVRGYRSHTISFRVARTLSH